MRELKMVEVERVSGGVLPLIGFAASMAGHHMARTAGQYAISRIGTITATAGAAEYLGSR